MPTTRPAPFSSEFLAQLQRQALQLRQELRREGGGARGGHELALVERLEVVPDLVVIVARHLLARDRVLHHLAVLPDDPEVHEARRHLACPAGEVRVVALLLAATRFALDADVVRTGAEPSRRVALRHGAPSLARQEPLALP